MKWRGRLENSSFTGHLLMINSGGGSGEGIVVGSPVHFKLRVRSELDCLVLGVAPSALVQ